MTVKRGGREFCRMSSVCDGWLTVQQWKNVGGCIYGGEDVSRSHEKISSFLNEDNGTIFFVDVVTLLEQRNSTDH